MIINNGPFAGTTAPASELKKSQRQDDIIDTWDVHSRTRTFLEKFNPIDGWCVQIDVLESSIKMIDPYTDNGAIQPTREFRASLVSPDGKIVAMASVLRMVNSEGAWKGGVTSARGALYEALGLPDSLTGSIDDDDRTRQSVPTKSVDLPAASSDGPQLQGVVGEVSVGMIETLPAEPERQEDADDDETEDAPTQGASSVESEISSDEGRPEGTTDVEPVVTAESTSDAEGVSIVEATEATDAPVPSDVPASSARNGKKSREELVQKALSKHPNGIPPSLLKQIGIYAKKANKVVPEFQSLDEAQAYLAKLRLPAGTPSAQGAIL